MDLSTLENLASPAGLALLAELPKYDETQTLKLSSQLQTRGVSADLAAAAITQSKLRQRATTKFGPFADQLFFTGPGLEQATRLSVGALHARRYLDAGCTEVIDLTCGIGADSLSFAALGLNVTAYELDPLTARIAALNLQPFPEAEIICGDGLSHDFSQISKTTGIYADPARRTQNGNRIFNPKNYQPALDEVWGLQQIVPNVGIKIGPGINSADLPKHCEKQWVSVNGQVVEAGLWFADLAPNGPTNSALILNESTSGISIENWQSTERIDAECITAQAEVGKYIYEPDGAIIRAHLINQVADSVAGKLIDPTIAYFTSDKKLENTQAATGYRIQDVFPFSLKTLKNYLRDQKVGILNIKKRGNAIVPEQLRKQLQLKGHQSATIIVTRLLGKATVFVVNPLT